MTRKVTLVTGAGAPNGLGAAIARVFAKNGHHVVVSGRTEEKIAAVAQDIRADGGSAEALVLDITDEAAVEAALSALAESYPGEIEAVIYNAGNNRPASILDTTSDHFEGFWRVGCFGGFLVGRAAARLFVAQGRGTILFTGASGSRRGKSGFAAFAAAKAGLRMLAQSMARELGPRGIHVAHIVIDGAIDTDFIKGRHPDFDHAKAQDLNLNPAAIAANYVMLHKQPKSAWTHELDLRPWGETW